MPPSASFSSSSCSSRSGGVLRSGQDRRRARSPVRSPPVASSSSSLNLSSSTVRPNPFSVAGSIGQSARGTEKQRCSILTGRRSASPVKVESGQASSASPATQDIKGKARELYVPQSHQQMLKKLVASSENALTTRKGNNAPIDVVVSCSSGHQVANHGPGRNKLPDYFAERNRKLKEQAVAKVDDIFRGVNVWIDGFVGSAHISDLEIKRLVSLHGGSIANAPGSRVTHIVTSTSLSGSKTHALMQKMRGWKPAVVRPEWVLESVKLGKRAAVGAFSVLSAGQTQKTLWSSFAVVASSTRALSSCAASPSQRPMSTPRVSCAPVAQRKVTNQPQEAPVVLVLDSDDE